MAALVRTTPRLLQRRGGNAFLPILRSRLFSRYPKHGKNPGQRYKTVLSAKQFVPALGLLAGLVHAAASDRAQPRFVPVLLASCSGAGSAPVPVPALAFLLIVVVLASAALAVVLEVRDLDLGLGLGVGVGVALVVLAVHLLGGAEEVVRIAEADEAEAAALGGAVIARNLGLLHRLPAREGLEQRLVRRLARQVAHEQPEVTRVPLQQRVVGPLLAAALPVHRLLALVGLGGRRGRCRRCRRCRSCRSRRRVGGG